MLVDRDICWCVTSLKFILENRVQLLDQVFRISLSTNIIEEGMKWKMFQFLTIDNPFVRGCHCISIVTSLAMHVHYLFLFDKDQPNLKVYLRRKMNIVSRVRILDKVFGVSFCANRRKGMNPSVLFHPRVNSWADWYDNQFRRRKNSEFKSCIDLSYETFQFFPLTIHTYLK